MRTKVPFAIRCLLLCLIFLLLFGLITKTLADMQIVQEPVEVMESEAEATETEVINAHRGIIMDRNKTVLTHNIMVAEVQIDRHKMRSVDEVTYGLAYNLLVHSDEWKKLTDPDKRDKMFRAKRNELLQNAKRKFTPEERAEILRNSLHDKSAAKKLQEYDPQICEQYFRAHDKLVAELLARFASKVPHKNSATAPLTEDVILEKIGQYEKEARINEAKKNGEECKLSLTWKIYLIKNLSLENAQVLKNMLHDCHIHGVEIANSLDRHYVVPDMLSHVMGTIGGDMNEGVSGIEAYYNDLLKGTNGLRKYHKDVRGQIVPHKDDLYTAPDHGVNLQLTIDMRIQAVCESALDQALRTHKTATGCVIVQEALSGDILAMVNRPAYNLNTREVITPDATYKYDGYVDRYGRINNGDTNYACQASIEPGSTMKSMAVLTSIDLGRLNWRSEVSGSPFVLGASKISDGSRSFPGLMYVSDALMMSSNPATARILIDHCSAEEYVSYLKKMGLMSPLPVSLPSVHKGFHLPKEKDKNGEIKEKMPNKRQMASMAYGYSIALSPLHVAQIYATIATGGVKVKPRLVKSMITPEGKIFDNCEPKKGETERVLKRETGRQMLLSLETVTQPNGRRGNGTGRQAAIPGFRVGGKTGTAEKIHPVTKKYISKHHIASFAGIFPLDENINWEKEMSKPEEERRKVYVMYIAVDGVPGGGGNTAAPVFKTIAENIIELENIKPTDPEAYRKHLEKKAAAQVNP